MIVNLAAKINKKCGSGRWNKSNPCFFSSGHYCIYIYIFFLIVYSLLNIHRDLPVLFCIFFGLLGHILCRGLPSALFSFLFFFAAPWTRTQTVAMPTWCTNALTTSATPREQSVVILNKLEISPSLFNHHYGFQQP